MINRDSKVSLYGTIFMVSVLSVCLLFTIATPKQDTFEVTSGQNVYICGMPQEVWRSGTIRNRKFTSYHEKIISLQDKVYKNTDLKSKFAARIKLLKDRQVKGDRICQKKMPSSEHLTGSVFELEKDGTSYLCGKGKAELQSGILKKKNFKSYDEIIAASKNSFYEADSKKRKKIKASTDLLIEKKIKGDRLCQAESNIQPANSTPVIAQEPSRTAAHAEATALATPIQTRIPTVPNASTNTPAVSTPTRTNTPKVTSIPVFTATRTSTPGARNTATPVIPTATKTSTPIIPTAAATAKVVSVSGNNLIRDGKAFISKGMIFETFLYPNASLQKCSKGGNPDQGTTTTDFCIRKLAARDFYFGTGDFTGSRSAFANLPAWGINTLRFNLNQSALDPQSPYYNSDYIDELKTAVRKARNAGYVVILTPFAGRNDNAGSYLLDLNPQTPLDNATTLRASRKLAQTFGDDKAVMFETLNEPFTSADMKGWLLWRDGGKIDGWPAFVGVKAIIEAIRKTGSSNVIIVQGRKATFEDFPGGLNDSQIAYSVHPFFNEGTAQDLDWKAKFGELSKTKPVIITAWGAHTQEAWCENAGIETVSEFLSYIKNRNISLTAYAFDIPYSVTKDFRDNPGKAWEMGSKCGEKGSAGGLMQDLFLSY